MRDAVIASCLVVAGIIHLPPVLGVVSTASLERLYGVAPPDATHALLLRHRAVLFGIVGALLIASAVRAELRMVAIGAGLVSVVSFLALAAVTPGTSRPIARVVRADWLALACLGTAIVLQLLP
jgi:hypothetical protein